MTDLVVFYSRSNNTRTVAQTISDETDAKILEVKDKKSRSGPIGYLIGGFDALREKKTNIEYEKVNLKDYDTVYVGTPVWASKPTPAIVEFIKENDFSGVNTITFATMGGSGGDTTINVMNNMIISMGGNVKKSFSLAIKNNNIKQLTLDALNDE